MRLGLLGLALAAGLAGGAAAPSPLASEAPREIRLHYSAQDREVGRFQYVPVRVPSGTTRLRIAYAYDKAGGANVVDLGLFEPGPLEIGTPAFRGWSGGAASEITVGTSAATPGYWPGPLPEGEWHVALGLYKVGPAGVDVTVTVETSAVPDPGPTPTLAPRPTGPLRAGPAWFSGGIHLHTRHSDGQLETAEVCRRAREAGLDFVVITDHNNTTHQLDAVDVPGLLRIVGEEVTTPGGHASVLGIGGWRDQVDFRLLAGDERIRDLVRAAHDRGALFVINHPRADCLGCRWEHFVSPGVAMEISGATAVEQGAALGLWDSLLQMGRHTVGLGSSDWHRPDHPIGMASVRVWAAELSERAILDAMRAGRVVVMADGATPPPELVVRSGAAQARVGDSLRITRGAAVRVEVAVPASVTRGRVDLVQDSVVVDSAVIAAGGAPIRFERTITKDGYLRVHVHGADGAPIAVTNPVFLEGTGRR